MSLTSCFTCSVFSFTMVICSIQTFVGFAKIQFFHETVILSCKKMTQKRLRENKKRRLTDLFYGLQAVSFIYTFYDDCRTTVTSPSPYARLTSSLTKYVFYNWLINNILYLYVT